MTTVGTVLARQAAPAATQAPVKKAEDGIPIHDAMVQKACAPCHTADEKQQISRISFRRNTPEGWQETIRRMVALNGLKIDPATARDVVRYLSNNLGLAPEEAQPAALRCRAPRDRLQVHSRTPTRRASATSAIRWAA